MSLIIMDCHRRLSDQFIDYLRSSTLSSSHVILTNLLKPNPLKSPLLVESQLDLSPSFPADLSSHISYLISHYLTLRDQYLHTSRTRGTLISFIIANSLLLMIYLVWTTYLYKPTFLSILGFMIVDFMVLMEVFVWTSLANESGYLVGEAIADHSLILFTHRELTGDQRQQLNHLITCLPYVRIEIFGIGKVTVRFKLAITITVGFAAAIIPKLIL